MSSQNFIDKLADTRAAIQALVTAISTNYDNRSGVAEQIRASQRFQRPAKSTVLEPPIRIIPDNDTTACTYTLPPSPQDGDFIEWRPSGTAFATNALVFTRNGKTIIGQAEDLTVDTTGSCGRLVWSSVRDTWLIDSLGYELNT